MPRYKTVKVLPTLVLLLVQGFLYGVFPGKIFKGGNQMRESQIAKRVIIDDLKEKFERCASFVIIDYKGLTVEKDTEFRAEFRKANVE